MNRKSSDVRLFRSAYQYVSRLMAMPEIRIARMLILLSAGIFITVITVTGAVAVVFWLSGKYTSAPNTPAVSINPQPSVQAPTPDIINPKPVASQDVISMGTPQPTPDVTSGPGSESSISFPHLIIPVAGLKPEQLRDTFTESRSQARVHYAIDIMAPRGTAVLAAAEGKIVKLFLSEKGGITIYQTSADQKLVFYYAHLDRYVEGLKEGQMVRQSETIGYVGDTGNAVAGNYHLHFAIWIITDPKRYWDGTNINPYPLLRQIQ